MNFRNVYLDLLEAYNWLKKQKGLLSLVLILCICNGLHGFIAVLLPPMVLSFTDATGLGFIESVAGLAFLVGSIISLRISDRIQGDMKVAIVMGLFCGLAIIIGSIRPSIYLLSIFGILEGVSGTIQWKFRDEIRPRFGIMRGREFYMKDAYSFDVSDEEAFYSYNKFFLSYLRTFKRLSLTAIPMAADTGPIGGNLSHEFIILADTGESKIFTDKRIFDLDSADTQLEKASLEGMRKKYEIGRAHV